MRLFRCSSELAEVEAQLESLDEALATVDKESGATRLIKELLERKKVLVGHCCFFDFLHLFNSFVGCDAPSPVASLLYLVNPKLNRD